MVFDLLAGSFKKEENRSDDDDDDDGTEDRVSS